MCLQGALCSKSCPLKDRLKLFQFTVNATVLYGSGTWTMNAALETRLRTTRRRMLRWMVGTRRRIVIDSDSIDENDDTTNSETGSGTSAATTEEEDEEKDTFEEIIETWVVWMRGATHSAEMHLR